MGKARDFGKKVAESAKQMAAEFRTHMDQNVAERQRSRALTSPPVLDVDPYFVVEGVSLFLLPEWDRKAAIK